MEHNQDAIIYPNLHHAIFPKAVKKRTYSNKQSVIVKNLSESKSTLCSLFVKLKIQPDGDFATPLERLSEVPMILLLKSSS